MFKTIFWNSTQRRLRTGWRIAIHSVFMGVLLASLTFFDLLVRFLLTAFSPGRGDIISEMTIGHNASLPIETLVAALVSIWLASRFLDRRSHPLTDLGFHFSGTWWADLGFGLALGAVLMTGIFLVERAMGWMTITGTFYATKSFIGDLLVMILTFISVGIYEELLVRGYWLKNLAEGLNIRRVGPIGAVRLAGLFTAILFGVLHMGNPNATWVSTAALMAAGVLFAVAYTLTGELAIPIGLHITWNFFQNTVYGFPVSGIDTTVSFVRIHQGGPALWTGGAFGPEAGLVGLGAISIGLLLTLVWIRMRHGSLRIRKELAIYPRKCEFEANAEMEAK